MNQHAVVFLLTSYFLSTSAVITCRHSSVAVEHKQQGGKSEGGRRGGLKGLAGVLMDVTMTTKDLLGDGGSERS